MSKSTVGGHKTRRIWANLVTQHRLYVYIDYLCTISPHTSSRALRALLMKGGGNSIRVDGRYTAAYGPHEVKLNLDGINICTTALTFADLERLPSNNTMDPVNARPLQDVRLSHGEENWEERPGRFLKTRAPIGQHVKRRCLNECGRLHLTWKKCLSKTTSPRRWCRKIWRAEKFRMGETIFAAYDKLEMRKAKLLVVASSDYVHTCKSLFWHDVTMMAATDLDLMHSVSMAIGSNDKLK